jgi:hypothetical protein
MLTLDHGVRSATGIGRTIQESRPNCKSGKTQNATISFDRIPRRLRREHNASFQHVDRTVFTAHLGRANLAVATSNVRFW